MKAAAGQQTVASSKSTAAETIAFGDFHARKAVFKDYGDQRHR
jgi:hypothetical protein